MSWIVKKRCLALCMLLLIALSFYWTFLDYETIMVHGRSPDNSVKRIAAWTDLFGDYAFPHIFKGKDEVHLNCSNQCTFHRPKGNALTYDALLFHAWDFQYKPWYRRPDQVYVIYNMESPYYARHFYIKGDFYNWTATHDPKSDFWMPYLHFRKKTKPGFPPRFIPTTLPQMKYRRKSDEAMVAWVVSNCNAPSKREQYVNILQRYIRWTFLVIVGNSATKTKS